MKHYVLDGALPVAAASHGIRSRSRAPLMWGLALASIALAARFVVFDGRDSSDPPSAAPSTARSSESVAMRSSNALTEATFPTNVLATAPASIKPSRVDHLGRDYLIELDGASPEHAVALLAKATGATVSGEEVLTGAAPITRSGKVATVAAAWELVFAETADFAMTCRGDNCSVSFISNRQRGSHPSEIPLERLPILPMANTFQPHVPAPPLLPQSRPRSGERQPSRQPSEVPLIGASDQD